MHAQADFKVKGTSLQKYYNKKTKLLLFIEFLELIFFAAVAAFLVLLLMYVIL